MPQHAADPTKQDRNLNGSGTNSITTILVLRLQPADSL
jgi:hypothetical protein